MNPIADFTTVPPFTVVEAEGTPQPFIFNSPHSGRHYPKRFLAMSRLDESKIRKSEDLFVDELFDDMPTMGATLLSANFPRAYLDVNREPYELDPKMFDGALPSYANVRSIRVAGGLGTVARVVAESHEIYSEPIQVEDALLRIKTLYRPYHAQLRKLFAKLHVTHGEAFLVDCHSMPSGASTHGNRPDFVLGDRYGTSCTPGLTELLATLLSDRGYSVNRNKPYAGGFITEHYGRPASGLHTIQLEINRGLYANEKTLAKLVTFDDVKADLNAVFDQVFKIFRGSPEIDLEEISLAAE